MRVMSLFAEYAFAAALLFAVASFAAAALFAAALPARTADVVAGVVGGRGAAGLAGCRFWAGLFFLGFVFFWFCIIISLMTFFVRYINLLRPAFGGVGGGAAVRVGAAAALPVLAAAAISGGEAR